MMMKIRIGLIAVLLGIALGGLSACKGKAKQEQEEQSPTQILLTQARELSRLELASSQLKTRLTIDPQDDGMFGWKKMFGSRATEVELISQASVSCDFTLLADSMLKTIDDSFVELRLPPLEVKLEFESMFRTVTKEADGMRDPLSENELNKILSDKRGQIDSLTKRALERAKPELYRSAEHSAITKLAPLFQDLGLGMRVRLSPQDEAVIDRSVKVHTSR